MKRVFPWLLFSVVALHATVTTTNQWHLGEADPGAVSGNAVNATTVDSIGSLNLTAAGSGLTYTNSVAAPGSTLGVADGGSGGYIGSVPSGFSGLQTNFGMQIWAKPTSTAAGNHAVIYLGNTATSGMGIYQVGGHWAVLFGGIVLQSSVAVTAGAWVDLALVVNTTGASFYINGALTSTVSGLPHAVAGNMMIGQNQGGTEEFIGSLDEANLFTFAAGQFNPSDVTPAPSASAPVLSPWGIALAALLLVASGIWLVGRQSGVRTAGN